MFCHILCLDKEGLARITLTRLLQKKKLGGPLPIYLFYFDICYNPIFLLFRIGSYFTQLRLILILQPFTCRGYRQIQGKRSILTWNGSVTVICRDAEISSEDRFGLDTKVQKVVQLFLKFWFFAIFQGVKVWNFVYIGQFEIEKLYKYLIIFVRLMWTIHAPGN